jgi:hypothetical protein
MTAAVSHVPSPADTPLTAEEFLAKLRERGGRVYRMRQLAVFCLTDSPETAQWLLDLGGVPYLPRNATPGEVTPRGAYRRARRGKVEWDIYIHTIPVQGEETIWEAAGRITDTVEAEDWA